MRDQSSVTRGRGYGSFDFGSASAQDDPPEEDWFPVPLYPAFTVLRWNKPAVLRRDKKIIAFFAEMGYNTSNFARDN